MKPFDVYIASIIWDTGAKRRPVLIVSNTEVNGALVFIITSQYEKKSAAIRARYFKINDWAQAGLEKKSYVDTMRLVKLPKDVINSATFIGELTAADKKKLIDFLSN